MYFYRNKFMMNITGRKYFSWHLLSVLFVMTIISLSRLHACSFTNKLPFAVSKNHLPSLKDPVSCKSPWLEQSVLFVAPGEVKTNGESRQRSYDKINFPFSFTTLFTECPSINLYTKRFLNHQRKLIQLHLFQCVWLI